MGTSFGAYAMPTYTPPPPVVSRKKTWRKTILLVSVKNSVKGKEKSGAVSYDVITQVVVNLSPPTCNVGEVSQMVAKQVDFKVVLLDLKLCWTTTVPVENLFGSLQGKFSQQTSNCIER